MTREIVQLAASMRNISRLMGVMVCCGSALCGGCDANQLAHKGGTIAREIKLADKGRTDYTIVESPNATRAEKYAATELSHYLSKATGTSFAVVPETCEPLPPHAIYVGWTGFAQRHGIDCATLDDNEWVIKSCDGNIILAGGRPRGSLYAVYEFLERQIGCHWLDESTEVVPVTPVLSLQLVDARAKPAFRDRHIYTGTPETPTDWALRARNKDTRGTMSAQYGFGYALCCHTFHSYSKNFPSDHPEYLAMNSRGERVASTNGSGPGQICLTHPEARKLMLAQLRSSIAKDREAAAKANDGCKPPPVYFISQNDAPWSCQCPDCKAFIEREGGASGPLIDLVNFLADGIRDEYPDVQIETFAYGNTITPPTHLLPRDNVAIRIAQLNGEWATDADGKTWTKEEYPDLLRPMTHPVNSKPLATMSGWSKIANHLACWDYWVQYHDKFPSPSTNIHCLQPDLQLFRDCKVESVFAEREDPATGSFFALNRWLGWKLMQDPDQDTTPLIKTFMEGYYGAAAGKMTDYLHHMTSSIAAVPADAGNMSSMKASTRPYLTLDFYRICQRLLDEAEQRCGADTASRLHVRRERIPVDGGLYCMWEQLEKQLPPGEAMPWDRESILKRYEVERLTQMDARGKGLAGSAEDLAKQLPLFRGISHSARKAEPPPALTVPKQVGGTPDGDARKADWTKACAIRPWRTLCGDERPHRTLSGAMTHDGKFLYLALEESGIDTSKLSNQWWAGDGWELFLAPQRGGQRGTAPYRQIAIIPTGECQQFEYDKGGAQTLSTFPITVASNTDGTCWKVWISIPLEAIVEGGVSPGHAFYLNIIRATPSSEEALCWIPTFENGYNDLGRLAKITLE